MKTNEETLELKIEKNESNAGKVYTIIHELTHLLNNHLTDRTLSSKQKEVVADTVALMFIIKVNLYNDYLKSNISLKWDVINYSKNYIFNMQLSNLKKEIIIDQIDKTYLELGKKLIK